jgi:hypothetical protein
LTFNFNNFAYLLDWWGVCSNVQAMKLNSIPEKLREQLRKAGRIRAAQITTEQRIEYGKRAWATRIAKARKAA